MLALIGGVVTGNQHEELFNGPFAGQTYGKYSKPATVKASENCGIKSIESCNNSLVTENEVWCWMKMEFVNCDPKVFEGSKCKGKANVGDTCKKENVSGDILEIKMFSDSWKGKSTELVPSGF